MKNWKITHHEGDAFCKHSPSPDNALYMLTTRSHGASEPAISALRRALNAFLTEEEAGRLIPHNSLNAAPKGRYIGKCGMTSWYLPA